MFVFCTLAVSVIPLNVIDKYGEARDHGNIYASKVDKSGDNMDVEHNSAAVNEEGDISDEEKLLISLAGLMADNHVGLMMDNNAVEKSIKEEMSFPKQINDALEIKQPLWYNDIGNKENRRDPVVKETNIIELEQNSNVDKVMERNIHKQKKIGIKQIKGAGLGVITKSTGKSFVKPMSSSLKHSVDHVQKHFHAAPSYFLRMLPRIMQPTSDPVDPSFARPSEVRSPTELSNKGTEEHTVLIDSGQADITVVDASYSSIKARGLQSRNTSMKRQVEHPRRACMRQSRNGSLACMSKCTVCGPKYYPLRKACKSDTKQTSQFSSDIFKTLVLEQSIGHPKEYPVNSSVKDAADESADCQSKITSKHPVGHPEKSVGGPLKQSFGSSRNSPGRTLSTELTGLMKEGKVASKSLVVLVDDVLKGKSGVSLNLTADGTYKLIECSSVEEKVHMDNKEYLSVEENVHIDKVQTLAVDSKHNISGSKKIAVDVSELELKICDWINEQWKENVTVTGMMVKMYALSVMTEQFPEFRVSDGWLRTFMERNRQVLQAEVIDLT